MKEWCRQFIIGCKRLEIRGAGVEYNNNNNNNNNNNTENT